MYAFTGHKWVLGPEGIGAFYVRPGLPVHSPNVGFMSLLDPSDFDIEGGYTLRSDARRFEASTMSPPSRRSRRRSRCRLRARRCGSRRSGTAPMS